MPSSAAIRSAVCRLSPVSMTGRMSCSLERLDRVVGGRLAAHRRSRSTPTARPSIATCTTVRPCPPARARGVVRPSSSMPSRSSRRPLPIASRLPSTVARAPWPGTASNRSGFTRRESSLLGCGHDRVGEWVLALAFRCGDEPQHLVLGDAVGGCDRDDFRFAAGERAGLVQAPPCRASRSARARSRS